MQRSHSAEKLWIDFQYSGLISQLFNIIQRCLGAEIFFSSLRGPHAIGCSASIFFYCLDPYICLISIDVMLVFVLLVSPLFSINLCQIVSDRGRLSESPVPDSPYMLSFPLGTPIHLNILAQNTWLWCFPSDILSGKEAVLRVGGPQLACTLGMEFESWLRWGESLWGKVTDNEMGSGTEAPQAELWVGWTGHILPHENIEPIPRSHSSSWFGKGSSCLSTYVTQPVHQDPPQVLSFPWNLRGNQNLCSPWYVSVLST